MQQPRLTLSALSTVFALADQLGAAIPKPVRVEHEALADLIRRARQPLDRQPVAEAYLAALAAGVDPLDDEGVRRAVIAEALVSRTGRDAGRDAALAQRAQDFLKVHAEAVFTALHKPFDAAAEAMSRAVAGLGPVDLAEPKAVLARGGDAARLWSEIQDAETVFTTVRRIRTLLAEVDRTYEVPASLRLLAIADVPPATFLDEQLGDEKLTEWQIVQRGFTLSLASPAVLRDRMAAVQAERERRRAEAETAGMRAFARGA